MNVKIFLVVIFIATAQTIYGQKFMVRGILLDQDDRTPIPGARVWLANLAGCQTTTGNEGVFIIECRQKPPEGNIEIQAQAINYETLKKPISIATEINVNYLPPVQNDYAGAVIDSLNLPVRNAELTVNGRLVRVGTDGKFKTTVSATRSGVEITCTAPGFEKEFLTKKISASKNIVLRKFSSSPIILAPKDSAFVAKQRESDLSLVYSLLQEACTPLHSDSYHLAINKFYSRLQEFYSPDIVINDPENALQQELDKVIVLLATRLGKYSCTEDILITGRILDFSLHNEYARRHVVSHLLIQEQLRNNLYKDLRDLRGVLSLLLLEGFKKMYITKNFTPLPLRLRNGRFVDYKNRAKAFEFVIGVSTPGTLKSNIYQAQSELIMQGKIQLPLNRLMAGWSWSEKTDQEHVIVNYFPSRRKAIKVASANSPLQCKVLLRDSQSFRDFKQAVDILRQRIDFYILLVKDLTFDGYQSFDTVMGEYSTFLSWMPCELTGNDKDCYQQNVFSWN
jgi:hypothetical protein